MTYTGFVLALQYPVMLAIGLAVLNAIFPPHYEWVDFILMITCVVFLYVFVSWGIMLNYGVETI